MQDIRSFYHLKQDQIVGTIVVMSSDHGEVHEGNMFKVDTYKTSLVNNGTYSVYWTNLTAKHMHLKQLELWINNAQAWADIHKGITATATGGKALVAYNCNQTGNVTATSGIVFKASATVNVAGSVRLDRYVFGGGGATPSARVGGQRDSSDETILPKNVKNAIVITNKSGSTASVHLKMRFYFETEAVG